MKLVRYADRLDLRAIRFEALSRVTSPRCGRRARRRTLEFPEDGDYVFPGALAPLRVRGGVGRHVEPNVWVRHRPPEGG